MKPLNLIIKLVLIFFFIISQYTYGQKTITEKKYDWYKINQYLIENHNVLKGSKYLNVLFSSNDCKMCISYLQSILPQVSDSQKLNINIFTDNVIYAKKNLNKYNLKLNYIYDKSIFTMFDIDSKTIVYLVLDNEIIYDVNKITYHLNNENDVVLRTIDSLLTKENISSTLLPFDKILTYDSKMETAILFEKETRNKDFSKLSYLYPRITDSLKLYNLAERVVNESILKKIDYKIFGKTMTDNSLRYIEIQSFSSFENIVYCTFIVNRLYENTEIKDNYGFIGNSFIASKEIKSETDIKNIMDISTFDNFYLIDLFNFNDIIYPTSIFIYDNFCVVDKNKIKIKVNKQIPNKHKLEFGGEITFKLKPENNTIQAIELKENVVNSFTRYNNIALNEFIYSIEKQTINSEKNSGEITLKKVKK